MGVLETAIGWLAPPDCTICGREGSALCELCQSVEILPHGERCAFCGSLSPLGRTCLKCRKSAPSNVFVCTDYAGAAQILLRAYKFTQQRAAHLEIAQLMAETLLSFNDQASLASRNYLIVPVPTATARRRQRGFDHAELLARRLSANLQMPTSFILGRTGQSRQVGAKRTVRTTQLAGSFYARRPNKIKGRTILLIDDVVTTGATLRAATKTLRAAGAKRVDALVFAKRL